MQVLTTEETIVHKIVFLDAPDRDPLFMRCHKFEEGMHLAMYEETDGTELVRYRVARVTPVFSVTDGNKWIEFAYCELGVR